MENQNYLKRKQDLMLKEFDTAFSSYQHIEGQLFNWRSLNITLLLAYFGFLFTRRVNNEVILLPLLIIPIPFFLFEVYRLSHLHFLHENIGQIESIFTQKDDEEFSRKIEAYVFRDQQLVSHNPFTYWHTWRKHVVMGFLVDATAIVWHVFILTSSISAYFFFASKLIHGIQA